MKSNKFIQLCMIATAILVTPIIHAKVLTSQSQSASVNNMTGKEMMRKIQKEMNEVRRKFNQGKLSAKQALSKLKDMPAKIEKAVAKLKAEDHGHRIYETHEHTLNRELRELKEHINKKAKMKKSNNNK